jgi:hypothetical protein
MPRGDNAGTQADGNLITEAVSRLRQQARRYANQQNEIPGQGIINRNHSSFSCDKGVLKLRSDLSHYLPTHRHSSPGACWTRVRFGRAEIESLHKEKSTLDPLCSLGFRQGVLASGG